MNFKLFVLLLLSTALLGCKPGVSFPIKVPTEIDTDPLNLSPIQLSNSFITEYSEVGTVVGILEQVQGEEVEYVLVNDNGGMFDLVNGNEIVVLNRLNMDYELSDTEDIVVQANSQTQGTRTDTLVISIANAETEVLFSNITVNPDGDLDFCNYTNSWVMFDLEVNLEVDKEVSVDRVVTYPLDNSTVLFTDFFGDYDFQGHNVWAGDEVFNLPGPATASNELIIQAITSDGYNFSISVNCTTETFTVF